MADQAQAPTQAEATAGTPQAQPNLPPATGAMSAPDVSNLPAGGGQPMQAPQAAAQAPAPAWAQRHAGLVKMLAGLTVGIDAAATSMATKGREGGVEEVQNYYLKQQQAQVQKQKAAQEAEEHDLRQKTMNANLLINQMNYQHAMMTFPMEQKEAQLKLQNATVNEFKNEKDTGESMGYDMADSAQASEARQRMGIGSASQQPGAITVPFSGDHQTADVMKAVSSSLPPGKSLTDYKVLPSYTDDKHGAGGTVTLVPNDSPLMQQPATPKQVANSEAEVKGMIAQAKAAGLGDDAQFKTLSGQFDTMEKAVAEAKRTGVGGPSTGDLFTMHQNVIGPLAKLVASQQSAAQITEKNQQAVQAGIKTDQEKTAQDTYMRTVPKNQQGQPTQDFATWQAAQNASAERAVQEGDPKVVGDMLASGLVSPAEVISSRSMSKAFYTQVIQAANNYSMAKTLPSGEANPNYTGKPYNMTAAAQQFDYVKDFNRPNGKIQQNLMANNTFLEHAGDLLDATAGYRTDSSKTRLLNVPINKLWNYAGSAEYARFIAALSPVKTEYENALKAGFAPTKEDIAVGNILMSDTSTPAQIEAATKQMSHTLLRRTEQINEGYKTHTGVDYPNLISPGARANLHKVGIPDVDIPGETGGTFAAPPQVVNRGATSQTPQGATHIVPGPDGKNHFTNAEGTVDLGIAP